ncbi:MAG: hypothetical protein ACK5IM_11820 [Demequina sp.]|uniref:hypothetical protein n=1 Tax=Demequina sp. TaxID=2050685 RepID=UPI003A8BF0A4
MITTATPRRRAGQRIASALWALLVIGAGVMLAVAFSGTDIDLELAAIIALAAVGGWLVLSAALSSIGRSREIREATAPVVEEPLVHGQSATDAAEADGSEADDATDAGVTEPVPAVAPTEPLPTAPSQATPTEVIFTEAAPSAPEAPDTLNQNEPRHAEATDASASEDGVADTDPVQSAGDDDDDNPEAKRG